MDLSVALSVYLSACLHVWVNLFVSSIRRRAVGLSVRLSIYLRRLSFLRILSRVRHLTCERNGAHPPVHGQEGPVLVEARIPERVPVEVARWRKRRRGY